MCSREESLGPEKGTCPLIRWATTTRKWENNTPAGPSACSIGKGKFQQKTGLGSWVGSRGLPFHRWMVAKSISAPQKPWDFGFDCSNAHTSNTKEFNHGFEVVRTEFLSLYIYPPNNKLNHGVQSVSTTLKCKNPPTCPQPTTTRIAVVTGATCDMDFAHHPPVPPEAEDADLRRFNSEHPALRSSSRSVSGIWQLGHGLRTTTVTDPLYYIYIYIYTYIYVYLYKYCCTYIYL